jgi:hypothetical protein
VTIAASMLASVAATQTVNFDNLATGAPPPGWTATKTGTGAAKFTVEKDDSAPSKPNVLKQSGQATYPVCIKDDTNLKDGFVEVKFKPISGKEDQAGGVVWRAKDSNNYYIARANALEDNVRFYRVVKGDRHQIEGVSLKIPSDIWQVLGLRAEGDKFTVMLNGKELFTATDRTFTGPGLVALWTKADSVTHFDQMVISRLQ